MISLPRHPEYNTLAKRGGALSTATGDFSPPSSNSKCGKSSPNSASPANSKPWRISTKAAVASSFSASPTSRTATSIRARKSSPAFAPCSKASFRPSPRKPMLRRRRRPKTPRQSQMIKTPRSPRPRNRTLRAKRRKARPQGSGGRQEKADERKKKEADEKKRITFAKNALAELKVHQLLAQGKRKKPRKPSRPPRA